MSTRNLGELLGQTLAGRFMLERVLGKGGYGAVFEATQLSMDRRCAVKVLAPRDGVDAKSMARFEREARSTSKLTHPNTITLYDFGEDRDHEVFFIAMEYLEGKDLSDHLQVSPMTVDEVVHVLKQVAASLDDAHRQGIVHRDIKPQNIMICPRPADRLAVKVIDFGIAKAMGDSAAPAVTALTMTGTIVGTPQYMSPEQVRDVALDGRSDQYSLAACAYAMLAGRPPFLGSSPIDIATRHLTDQPLPVSVLMPSLQLSSAFDDALLRALAKAPDERFETCVAFVEALASACSSQSPVVEFRRENGTTDSASATAYQATSQVMAPSSVTLAPGAAVPATGPVVVEAVSPNPETSEANEEFLAGVSHTLALRTSPPPAVSDVLMEQERGPTRPNRSGHPWLGVGLVAVFVIGGSLSWLLWGRNGVSVDTTPVQPAEAAELETNTEDEVFSESAEAQPPVVATGEDVAPRSNEGVVPSIGHADVKPHDSPLRVDTPKKPFTPTKARTQDESVVAPKSEVETLPKAPIAEPPGLADVDVVVTIRPWGTLFIDGKKHSSAARQVIALEVGRHTFELKQDELVKVKKVVQVDEGFSATVHLVAE